MDHAVRNTIHAENFTRSATAPLMSAGVMMANIIWYTQKASGGTERARAPL